MRDTRLPGPTNRPMRWPPAAATLLVCLAAGGAAFANEAPTTEEACTSQGGAWGRFGHEREACDLPTGDAGKPCSGPAECEGACITTSRDPIGTPTIGHCTARTLAPNSCVNEVRDGVTQGITCEDRD